MRFRLAPRAMTLDDLQQLESPVIYPNEVWGEAPAENEFAAF